MERRVSLLAIYVMLLEERDLRPSVSGELVWGKRCIAGKNQFANDRRYGGGNENRLGAGLSEEPL